MLFRFARLENTGIAISWRLKGHRARTVPAARRRRRRTERTGLGEFLVRSRRQHCSTVGDLLVRRVHAKPSLHPNRKRGV